MTLRTVLYVDDSPENLNTLRRVLRGTYELDTVQSGAEAIAQLEKTNYPVLIVDQRMPQMTGVEFLKQALRQNSDRVGLLLTAYADLDALVEGVNSGVIYRYLTKPWKESDLIAAIRQAFEKHDLTLEKRRLVEDLKRMNHVLRDEIDSQFDFSGMTGQDGGLKQVSQAIKKVAPTHSTVLIRGESGVGKELVARAIHQLSPRSEKPLVRVNCGALAESLLESELFGHEKGAFTGAATQRIGRLEAAQGGTLFLDEIGDISSKLQVALLRVIQEKEFERVGGITTLYLDVRILAATHQDLEALTKKGTFRQDLYYRLNVFPILVPPLRDRMSDLATLAARLLEKGSQKSGVINKVLSAAAHQKLKAYDWPGNVRELENVLERALILSTQNEILPEDIVLGSGLDPSEDMVEATPVTREQIETAIRESNGNKVQAARRLGMKRPTLYYHLKRLRLE